MNLIDKPFISLMLSAVTSFLGASAGVYFVTRKERAEEKYYRQWATLDETLREKNKQSFRKAMLGKNFHEQVYACLHYLDKVLYEDMASTVTEDLIVHHHCDGDQAYTQSNEFLHHVLGIKSRQVSAKGPSDERR